ncbi:polysaccharide biosynthesis tyrosine autokinase [Aerococcaceae bacterium DSM 109653]|uniref:Tyrosine-protein kinase CpsD n=1 Tax=Fundicoccus ignavus TaxID=2664442 RepID=A0A844BIP3_9LACT|nr:CpsD/CapB family tyrosine-protein kinase [Fundicoccus ignavus]MRI80844.1 polysaccharide biosynthesis tyrosine autokinase [Fundicoccus ignavus]
MFSSKKKQHNAQKTAQKASHLISFTHPKASQAEQFRTIRTNINFAQLEKNVKSLLVSSSIPNEGKSTLTANLAYVMAQTGKKVLLVDADLRKPTVHRTFKLNNTQGLTTLIADEDETIKFNQIVQYSRELNLYFLPSGPVPPNPSELLGSAKMRSILNTLENHFDLIIFDAPPTTTVTDPQILATLVDGVVFVIRQGFVGKDKVKEAILSLQNLNTTILGYVFNDVPKSSDKYYYYE